MSAAVDRVNETVHDFARDSLERIERQLSDKAKPMARRILAEWAIVSIRAAAGEDVTTATVALKASTANLARAEKSFLEAEARMLALRAALFVLQAAIP